MVTVKWMVIVLLLVSAQVAATLPPAPPGGFQYSIGEEGVLTFHWDPAAWPLEEPSGEPVENYNFYYTINGNRPPPTAIASTETSYEFGALDEGKVYAFWVTTVDTSGLESTPLTPIVMVGGEDYPRCTFLPIRIIPPQVPQPGWGCILPPP